MFTKKFATFVAALLAVPALASSQAAVEADLERAKAAYANSNVELAKSIFTTILASKSQVTTDQKVEAYKYLGGYWALNNKPDSAISYFVAMLDYDPFATLDSTFAADEQAAFAKASGKIFKVGIKPVETQALDPRSPDPAKRTYTFRIVTTHLASINAEVVNLADSARLKETFQTIANNSGVRELIWNGLINTQRADSGLYALVVRAIDRQNNTPTVETHKFRIEHIYAPLEDTLPSFVDVRAGGTDTLTSRRPGSVPILDGSKGFFIAGFAAGLPALMVIQKNNMSGYSGHYFAGIMLGVIGGGTAAWWGVNHRDDRQAVNENARRRQARAEFNAAVLARNRDRLDKTILVLRPVGG